MPILVLTGFTVFQSTLPRRERRDNARKEHADVLFQSTLPRRERLARAGDDAIPARISIHAPAKGATARFVAVAFFSTDFNPRSREGSDILYSPVLRMDGNFNPRSREGSDGAGYHGLR